MQPTRVLQRDAPLPAKAKPDYRVQQSMRTVSRVFAPLVAVGRCSGSRFGGRGSRLEEQWRAGGDVKVGRRELQRLQAQGLSRALGAENHSLRPEQRHYSHLPACPPPHTHVVRPFTLRHPHILGLSRPAPLVPRDSTSTAIPRHQDMI